MENDFFKNHLLDQGLEVVVPSLKQREEIQVFQSKLSKGIIEDSAKEYFINLLKKYNDVDAVVLGCTELPLVIEEQNIEQYILNPLELQCKEAFEYTITNKV